MDFDCIVGNENGQNFMIHKKKLENACLLEQLYAIT